MTANDARNETQVFRVFIKATPQQVWDAITKPEWTDRYGYRGRAEFELKKGGKYQTRTPKAMLDMGAPDPIVDGEVIESDPPRKLVQTWRALWGPELIAEGAKRLTWEISDAGDGVTAVTVIHELEGAPLTAAMVKGTAEGAAGGGGWSWVLSDLKSLLETGASMHG